MTIELFLTVGTVAMLTVMLYIRKYYNIVLWKTIILTLALTLCGLFGTQVMFWLESGEWGGTSFFGAIFLVPIFMTIVATFLKIPIGAVLDMCAPAECIMLALFKIRCMYFGCCQGKILYTNENFSLRFPSQIVELITALCLLVVLIRFIKKIKYKNQIYPKYMIGYGITRFILNLMRETTPFVGILPAGNFWSIISTVIGIVWLMNLRKDKWKVRDVYGGN